MFGNTKARDASGQNVILLDIESSSVGAGLVHIEEGSAPVLFGERRTLLAMPRTISGPYIAKQIETAAHEALGELSLFAAQLRSHNAKGSDTMGTFTRAAIFLGAPWGTPNLALGKPIFTPLMQRFLYDEVQAIADDIPLSFYTGADSAAYGSGLVREEGISLIVILRGEIIELVLLDEKGILGYATLPVGSRSVYRTLQTHGSLSPAEIPAVLALAKNPTNPYYQRGYEPLKSAGRHVLDFFVPSVEALTHAGMPQNVIILAEEPWGGWLARTLESDPELGTLFTEGATVRTMGGKHAAAQLGGHALTPDLHVSLAALFMHGKLLHRAS